jgi:hypothetical protein
MSDEARAAALRDGVGALLFGTEDVNKLIAGGTVRPDPSQPALFIGGEMSGRRTYFNDTLTYRKIWDAKNGHARLDATEPLPIYTPPPQSPEDREQLKHPTEDLLTVFAPKRWDAPSISRGIYEAAHPRPSRFNVIGGLLLSSAALGATVGGTILHAKYNPPFTEPLDAAGLGAAIGLGIGGTLTIMAEQLTSLARQPAIRRAERIPAATVVRTAAQPTSQLYISAAARREALNEGNEALHLDTDELDKLTKLLGNDRAADRLRTGALVLRSYNELATSPSAIAPVYHPTGDEQEPSLRWLRDDPTSYERLAAPMGAIDIFVRDWQNPEPTIAHETFDTGRRFGRHFLDRTPILALMGTGIAGGSHFVYDTITTGGENPLRSLAVGLGGAALGYMGDVAARIKRRRDTRKALDQAAPVRVTRAESNPSPSA